MAQQDTQFICPNCKKAISIDLAVRHQVEDGIKKEIEQKAQREVEEERKRDREKMVEWKKQLEEQARERDKEKEREREKEREKERESILAESSREVKLLREENTKKQEELIKARELELKIRQERNQLEEEKQALKLEVARQVDAERENIRKKVEEQIVEDHRLKEKEKDKVIEDLRKSLEDAQRKASQGSQQLQGEVLELELENFLKGEFPLDEILPVPKGMNGADVLQRVFDQSGRFCGTIIWESKRTKNWSEEWVAKLKDDLRASKSDVAIIVSLALPEGVKNFGPRDGVIVTDYQSLQGVARTIRLKVIELCLAKLSTVGQNEKMAVIYNYLRGNEFKARVEAIVEAFTLMKEDLEKEKISYTKMWAKREKQIQRVIESTVGMHGDLHGLMGASLPEIASIEMGEAEEVEAAVMYAQDA